MSTAPKKYTEHISNILNIPLSVKEGSKNELTPRVIELEENSKRLWIGYADEVELGLKDGGKYDVIRGFANKLPEHATRLSAVFTLIEDPDASVIIPEKMEAGIHLANYYAEEALRLFGEGIVDPKLLLAERLLCWLQTKWSEKTISLPDIYQRSLNLINNKKIALDLVNILEEHGWLFKINEGGVVNGQFRRDVWLIVNKV